MIHLFVTLSGSAEPYTGRVYYRTPGQASYTALTLPSGVSASNVRPTFLTFRNRTFIIGTFNPGLVFTEDRKLVTLGLASPKIKHTLGVAAGAYSLLTYLTYVCKTDSGTELVESAPSYAVETLNAAVPARSWGSLPGSGDALGKATHIRGYVGVDGNSARRAWERTLPIYSVTEAKPTLALGSLLNSDRGIPPYTRFAEIYHERLWYAGSPTYPERIWFSGVGDPENVYGLNFFSTPTKEPVTGLKRCGDQLLVFCQNSTHVVQGYTLDDFICRTIAPSIGCAASWSIQNIHDRVWFMSAMGPYVYDGQFSFAGNKLRKYYAAAYAAARADYENGFTVDDRKQCCYVYSVPLTSGTNRTLKWVAEYKDAEPNVGGVGGPPNWMFDVRARQDTAAGLLSDTAYCDFSVHTGDSTGYVRAENVAANADDDGDTYQKALTIQTGVDMAGDPGGDVQEGRSYSRLWSYVESESNAWRVAAYGGDETALNQATYNWKDDVAASALSGGGHTWVAKTTHAHIIETVVGRGIAFKYTATAPVGMKWKGFGGTRGPGPAFRGQAT